MESEESPKTTRRPGPPRNLIHDLRAQRAVLDFASRRSRAATHAHNQNGGEMPRIRRRLARALRRAGGSGLPTDASGERVHVIRPAARVHHLAYGCLRGVSYERMEDHCRVAPDLRQVGRLVAQYGVIRLKAETAEEFQQRLTAQKAAVSTWMLVAEVHLAMQGHPTGDTRRLREALDPTPAEHQVEIEVRRSAET